MKRSFQKRTMRNLRVYQTKTKINFDENLKLFLERSDLLKRWVLRFIIFLIMIGICYLYYYAFGEN